MLIRNPILPALALLAMLAGCQSLGSSMNVLKQVDPARDSVSGRWEFDGNILQSEVTHNACISLPAVPHGDYRLMARFARVVGQGSANIILPVGDRQVLLVLAGGPVAGPYSGLEFVDGQQSGDNITTDRTFELINHRIYRADVTVRTQGTEARVEVDIDKRPFIRWLGPVSSLSLPSEWALTGGATLGLGAGESVVQYRAVTLRMLPGETTWVN